MYSARSNSHGLLYKRFKPSDCKDIWRINLEFDAQIQFFFVNDKLMLKIVLYYFFFIGNPVFFNISIYLNINNTFFIPI